MSTWKEVKKRRPKQRESQKIISFYIMNVPRDVRKSEIWRPCARLGNLVDVYISRRRDSGGLFFAFVRYTNVGCNEEMVNALNDVSIGGRKISANVSMHPRGSPAVAGRKAPPPPVRHHIPPER